MFGIILYQLQEQSKDFAKVARKYNIKRVQTAVRSDFDKGIRFAEWLIKKRGINETLWF